MQELSIKIVQAGGSITMSLAEINTVKDRRGRGFVRAHLLATRGLKDVNLDDYAIDILAPAILLAISDEITGMMPFLR